MSAPVTKAGARKSAKKKGVAKRQAGIRLADHPRARTSIQKAKSYAGLGAFLLAGYAQWNAGGQFLDVASSALLWGIAAYVLVWALAVQVWRHIAIAEVRAAQKAWEDKQDREKEQVAKLTQVLEENGMPTTGTGVPPVL
jgi:hypothetical protein